MIVLNDLDACKDGFVTLMDYIYICQCMRDVDMRNHKWEIIEQVIGENLFEED